MHQPWQSSNILRQDAYRRLDQLRCTFAALGMDERAVYQSQAFIDILSALPPSEQGWLQALQAERIRRTANKRSRPLAG